MAFRMTLRRIVPVDLASQTAEEQTSALGFLTVNVVSELVVGRDPNRCQLALAPKDPDQPVTSGVHARFRFSSGTGKATVEDLKSSNGTFINGQRMTGEHPLLNGDVVALARARFSVEIVDTNATEHSMTGRTLQMNLRGDESVSILDLGEDGGDDAGKSMIG